MTKIALRKSLSQDLVLRKKTTSSESSVFGTVSTSYTNYDIKGLIRIIRTEDLRFMPPGTLTVGNARGFFFSSYTLEDGSTVSVAINDIIIENSVQWRVDSILSYPVHKEDILDVRLVRRG